MKLYNKKTQYIINILQLVTICGLIVCILMEVGKAACLVMLGILVVTIFIQNSKQEKQTSSEANTPIEEPARTHEKSSAKDNAAAKDRQSSPEHMASKEDKLRSSFEEYLIASENFLQPGLTIVNVAEELGTNKTYLSKIVNSTYGMTFPELINSLRIDYAEQYILHNRDAKQADVAMACGFANASAFNNSFKKLVGLTPKAWLEEKTQ